MQYPPFATDLGLQKGASELDAGDLASLVGGIFGLSKFGRDDDGGGGWRGKDDDTGKSTDGVIKPSLSPDPDRKPEGKPTEINPDLSPRNTQDLKTENDTALMLAQSGWRVEQNPDSNKLPQHIQESNKKPDYIVEGIVMDCYAPGGGKPMEGIWQVIREKVEGNQAEGVVLNLDNRSDADEVIKYLTTGDIGIRGIRAIIVVKDGKTRVIYP